jgi:pyruvate kinase
MSVVRDSNVLIDVLPARFRKATKQLATLGPASSSFEMVEKLFLSGADVFRLNFSHGEHAEKAKLVDIIRAVEKKYDHPIGILGDLQGPKLRVGTFENDEKVYLEDGQDFTFDMEETPGCSQRVQLPHPEILKTLSIGDTLLIDDGKMRMTVTGSDFSGVYPYTGSVKCKVIIGGMISNRKGVNTPSIVLPISPLTPKDRKDLEYILTLEIDWVALSFVQTPGDIEEIKELCGAKNIKVMAKLEKPSAIDYLDEIVDLSDGIMVARGDLGVEMNPWDVPVIQKRILKACQEMGKPCVIATQMMESMIENPTPTRAEASDCGTAIFDTADAVMLSAESAAGKYPVESVTMQQLIINKIEGDPVYRKDLVSSFAPSSLHVSTRDPTVAITMAARQVADISKSKALICFTSSGGTAMRAARFRPSVPIVAACYNLEVARQLAMVWNVYPIVVDPPKSGTFNIKDEVAKICKATCEKGFADESKDVVTITAGLPFGTVGVCNYLRVVAAAGPDYWYNIESSYEDDIKSYAGSDGVF